VKRRKGRSSLYQVDFVAALFGAFLLLWVSKKSGISRETENHIVVFEARCIGGDHAWLVPSTSLQRCSSKSLAELAESGLMLKACESRPADKDAFKTGAILQGAPSYDGQFLTQSTTDTQAVVSGAVAAKMNFGSDNQGFMIALRGLSLIHKDYEEGLVAVGIASSIPPDYVDISELSEAVLATRCKACTDTKLYLHLGKSQESFHPGFEITIHSDGWPQPCLKAKWNPPSSPRYTGNKVPFEKCVP
jgi:hypothetical protein